MFNDYSEEVNKVLSDLTKEANEGRELTNRMYKALGWSFRNE